MVMEQDRALEYAERALARMRAHPLGEGARRIGSVAPGSPAAKAGLRAGDVILEINKTLLPLAEEQILRLS